MAAVVEAEASQSARPSRPSVTRPVSSTAELATSIPPQKQTLYENTYITGPSGYGESYVFKRRKVQDVIRQALQERMEGGRYDPVKGAQQAKQLADDVRERVKALGFERHKLVVMVTLGQKQGQGQRVVSRCLWDMHTDGWASEVIESETVFCTCQVYALYFE
ncbi:hypothetical protein WJX81_000680 [Elliptochloris bilobata]|uniref:Uncharacterized protein n=1 Tax=Elliptochloris bilobata TaxID=381761 RepID=A0AAW1S412_9CHLO